MKALVLYFPVMALDITFGFKMSEWSPKSPNTNFIKDLKYFRLIPMRFDESKKRLAAQGITLFLTWTIFTHYAWE